VNIAKAFRFIHAGLTKKFDVILMPNANKTELVKGRGQYGDGTPVIYDYASEYKKGMGEKGKEALLNFVEQGGRIVSWGRSTELFMGLQKIGEKEFILPIRDVSKDLKKKGLYCPGSLVRIQLNNQHPLAFGMPEEIGVFYRAQQAFKTRIPDLGTDRRVIAWFPDSEQLMSGYAEKEELLSGKSAMVLTKKGDGDIIFMAFGPQFRASTGASYKLLWNSVLMP